MDDARFREAVVLQAGDQAIAVVLGAAGHREQQGGLVDHQQGGVLVEDFDLAERHGVGGFLCGRGFSRDAFEAGRG
ncbi:hypothetical protein D3C86_1897550 [compost metagenome]